MQQCQRAINPFSVLLGKHPLKQLHPVGHTTFQRQGLHHTDIGISVFTTLVACVMATGLDYASKRISQKDLTSRTLACHCQQAS
ncbi:hypothetical protein D3C78_1422210 [compost metagenome]